MDKALHVFTDGSAIGNPGPGGWAAVLIRGGKRWETSGSSSWTTISEMELLAAVEALRSIPARSNVQLCSDAELLIHGMCFHIWRWQRQEWRNNRGIPLHHQELWKELLVMNERMNIRGNGSEVTAGILSRLAPIFLPTGPLALNGAACQ